MKHSERFALMEWLSEFPDDKTYDEIIEMLNVDDWIDPDISVWEVVESYGLKEVADMIENTRMHFESVVDDGLVSALHGAIKLAQENAPDMIDDEDFTERLNALLAVLWNWSGK
jgi:hypothetical protein